MTTEKQGPTAEDVALWHREVRADVLEHIRVGGEKALARLRDLALLGVQVPGLRADNAALFNLHMDKPAHVFNGSCPDDIEGWDSRDPECSACQVLSQSHPGAALLAEHEAKVSAIQARVAELERQQGATARSLKSAIDNAERATAAKQEAESERDALRSQVTESERATATLQVERNRAIDYQKVLRQRFDTARNDALEEAAVRIDVEAQESHTRETAALLDDMAARIRALKTAALPAPPAEEKEPPCGNCGESEETHPTLCNEHDASDE